MSFTRRGVELLAPEKEELYPDFFEPRPLSPIRKPNILFADNNGNIHMTFQEKTNKKYIFKRHSGPIVQQVSILGKRKLDEAFGEEIYKEKERYGQDIPVDFFQTNIGHGVYILNHF